ncbi:MAG: tetratricopeptide repeat protein [Vicinamibacterales bacterium]
MSPTAASFRLFTGDHAHARAAAADEALRAAGARVHRVRSADWPFTRRVAEGLPVVGPLAVHAPDLQAAFPAGQSGSTRLVLTQSTYQLQRWIDWLDRRGDVVLVAEADRERLLQAAPEAFRRRGPWSRVDLVEIDGSPESSEGPSGTRSERSPAETSGRSLYRAFVIADPGERLAVCRREAAVRGGDPVVQLALGSAFMEVQDLDASQGAIERAIVQAPDWEAAHYELGKLRLRRDDLEGAGAAFAEAGRLMPAFAAAFSNLGATLGELDRADDALAAFRQALTSDPTGYTLLNNIGVVSRELGRLDESEAALRRVVSLAPEFVFGHYNLGHTLFLQGRYQAALSAYVEGQRRDPEKNARQACRLAVVRLAAGDPEGSLRDLARSTDPLPPDERREVLAEAQEILWALLTGRPGPAGWKQVADAVKSRLEALP